MIQIGIWCVGALSAPNLVLIILALKRMTDLRKEKGEHAVQDELRSLRDDVVRSDRKIRNEIRASQVTTANTLVKTIGELGETQARQIKSGTEAIDALTRANETRMEKVRITVDERLQGMQTSNEDKLDQMRKTVDEKLQSTLEKRLGESFNQVSKRLEEVQRGLGEMQELATGVGDLKRVLTNVKTRGIWGEVQLGALLEDILTPNQYSLNVQVNEDSREEVEYAIRLPGSDDEPNSCVWLPIDSKFPLADYEKLVQASEAADKDEIEKATATFLATVHNEAKTISEKYIAPPKTTDFAVMFLPTEGLYAEVLRSPGEVAHLMHRYRIVVAGPTTLAAILSSLRMGFRTLAIEKRSSEVWKILAAVKTEFGKFGDVMAKLKKQLKNWPPAQLINPRPAHGQWSVNCKPWSNYRLTRPLSGSDLPTAFPQFSQLTARNPWTDTFTLRRQLSRINLHLDSTAPAGLTNPVVLYLATSLPHFRSRVRSSERTTKHEGT